MKIDKIAFGVVTVLLAAMFGMSGGFKVFAFLTGNFPPEMSQMHYPTAFIGALGLGEVAAAAALFLPKYRAYGLLFLVCVLCGALATHITKGDGNMVVPMLGILALPILGIWLNKRVNGATVSL